MDLAQAAAAAVATMRAAEPGHEHEWTLELDTVLVSADPTRVDQVLANLLGNAVQHSPGDTRVDVALLREPDALVISIHNEGDPIPPDLLPELFEPFRRGASAGAKSGSMGLGLFITRRIVEAHRGHIEVTSTAEAGTTFRVCLPRKA